MAQSYTYAFVKSVGEMSGEGSILLGGIFNFGRSWDEEIDAPVSTPNRLGHQGFSFYCVEAWSEDVFLI